MIDTISKHCHPRQTMKQFIPVVLALVVGFAGGWFLKKEPVLDRSTALPSLESNTVILGGRIESAKVPRQQESPATDIIRRDTLPKELDESIDTIRRIPDLTPEDYAVRLESLMREGLTLNESLEQTAMFSMANAEQGAAFYRLHKEEAGLSSKLETKEFRNFLLMMGQKNGRRFLDHIIEEIPPDSSGDASSITHGWAIVEPQAAANWLNELPDDHPLLGLSMRGVIFGVAQSNVQTAITVFNGLDPLDVNDYSIDPFANSLVMNHGLAAMDDYLASDPSPEIANRVIEKGLWAIDRRPSDEYLPWAAPKLDSYPMLQSHFRSTFQKWALEDPTKSVSFFYEQAASPTPSVKSLEIMTQQLLVSGQEGTIQIWLEKSSESPGHSAVQQAWNNLYRPQ